MSFEAKYRGVCEDCGEDVLPRQEVTYVGKPSDGDIRHVVCPETVTALAKRGACPSCFLELPVTGKCEECHP